VINGNSHYANIDAGFNGWRFGLSRKNRRVPENGRIMSAIARNRMKNWEIIAEDLKKAGWSLGWVSALDCEARTIWIADAHRDNGRRFVVRADDRVCGIGIRDSPSLRINLYRESRSRKLPIRQIPI
jgi:hypothetical protein